MTAYLEKINVPYNRLHDKGLIQHRLRSLYPRHRARRTSPRRPLVVGNIQERVWFA